MTEQQRKAIEVLNNLRDQEGLNGSVISEDDYFLLLSSIIDKPQKITVPAPYPGIQLCPLQPLTPLYGQQWETICKAQGTNN